MPPPDPDQYLPKPQSNLERVGGALRRNFAGTQAPQGANPEGWVPPKMPTAPTVPARPDAAPAAPPGLPSVRMPQPNHLERAGGVLRRDFAAQTNPQSVGGWNPGPMPGKGTPEMSRVAGQIRSYGTPPPAAVPPPAPSVPPAPGQLQAPPGRPISPVERSMGGMSAEFRRNGAGIGPNHTPEAIPPGPAPLAPGGQPPPSVNARFNREFTGPSGGLPVVSPQKALAGPAAAQGQLPAPRIGDGPPLGPSVTRGQPLPITQGQLPAPDPKLNPLRLRGGEIPTGAPATPAPGFTPVNTPGRPAQSPPGVNPRFNREFTGPSGGIPSIATPETGQLQLPAPKIGDGPPLGPSVTRDQALPITQGQLPAPPPKLNPLRVRGGDVATGPRPSSGPGSPGFAEVNTAGPGFTPGRPAQSPPAVPNQYRAESIPASAPPNAVRLPGASDASPPGAGLPAIRTPGQRPELSRIAGLIPKVADANKPTAKELLDAYEAGSTPVGGAPKGPFDMNDIMDDIHGPVGASPKVNPKAPTFDFYSAMTPPKAEVAGRAFGQYANAPYVAQDVARQGELRALDSVYNNATKGITNPGAVTRATGRVSGAALGAKNLARGVAGAAMEPIIAPIQTAKGALPMVAAEQVAGEALNHLSDAVLRMGPSANANGLDRYMHQNAAASDRRIPNVFGLGPNGSTAGAPLPGAKPWDVATQGKVTVPDNLVGRMAHVIGGPKPGEPIVAHGGKLYESNAVSEAMQGNLATAAEKLGLGGVNRYFGGRSRNDKATGFQFDEGNPLDYKGFRTNPNATAPNATVRPPATPTVAAPNPVQAPAPAPAAGAVQAAEAPVAPPEAPKPQGRGAAIGFDPAALNPAAKPAGGQVAGAFVGPPNPAQNMERLRNLPDNDPEKMAMRAKLDAEWAAKQPKVGGGQVANGQVNNLGAMEFRGAPAGGPGRGFQPGGPPIPADHGPVFVPGGQAESHDTMDALRNKIVGELMMESHFGHVSERGELLAKALGALGGGKGVSSEIGKGDYHDSQKTDPLLADKQRQIQSDIELNRAQQGRLEAQVRDADPAAKDAERKKAMEDPQLMSMWLMKEGVAPDPITAMQMTRAWFAQRGAARDAEAPQVPAARPVEKPPEPDAGGGVLDRIKQMFSN